MVASISQWDPGSLVYFSTMVHTYPWDPGIVDIMVASGGMNLYCDL
jgi:hypothetical protein